MNATGMLLRMAWRSMISHWVKSLIVGGIICFGTFLLVVGTALLDSVERSMERSITASITGHLQVYSDDAQDELAIFGGMSMGAADIGEIGNFGEVKAALEAVPNVKAVVPMGTNIATVMGGNNFDRVLGELRDAVDAGDTEAIETSKEQLRRLAEFLSKEYRNRLVIASDPTEIEDGLEVLEKVQSDAFWQAFDEFPAKELRFLDTKVAKLASDGRTLFLRSIGTDLWTFAESFDRFELTDGEMVPEGQRGFLLNKRFHERYLKNLVARHFDRLHEARADGTKIADDKGLEARTHQMVKQANELVFDLEPDDITYLETALKAELPGVDGDIEELLTAFLEVDDDNFDDRYDFFYAEIAPRIQLYDVNVGDTITLRSVTKTGYFKAANVKVYGRYTFTGLERSDLSGAFNLLDLMTFRDLYGLMTDEQRAELEGIREAVGVEEVSREDAEDALFGGSSDEPLVTASESDGIDEFRDVAMAADERQADLDRVFAQAEIDEGLALHAAIVLEDPEAIDQTRVDIVAAIEKGDLGLQVVDWQEASGLVGQFVLVIQLVLYIAITIIFLVALVIINNSMVMSTMDRIGEIGTMRAIGAQRRFVLGMFLVETTTLGLLAGLLGAGMAAALIFWMGSTGIPAGTNDILVFLFSGPRLYPSLGVTNVVFGFVVIVVVSLLATLYPAFIATRVQPVEAMRARD